ncbi:ArsR/SmtB family transcription factor [Paenibacillus flagellatus]|uniref:Transcriptional regulator n=1 Tax=Paenibacillus flagellatus TaxID=2211139 RepID=A0A2V5K3I7_9BACL|nr:helix-turn-helix domain-containing protein [Paenibacillus flagellatus]PYI53761.1 transcriptional regulator [Paenibacillus flagellatus]
MQANPDLAEIASLIGDSSRSAMLMRLFGGEALPAGELARAARISPQTASSHLAKLVEGGLLVQETYGRHRYYRLAGAEVAHALEALCTIAPRKPIRSLRESDRSRALRYARTCYDHIAGEVGVALTAKLLELGCIEEVEEDGRSYALTPAGAARLERFGVPADEWKRKRGRRRFARPCLDWSERRHHLAGSLGAALTARLFALGWLERIPGGRAVRVTEAGVDGFRSEFSIDLR